MNPIEKEQVLYNRIMTLSKYQGGIFPSGNINIVENGEYDVTEYAQATVNISSFSLEEKDVNFYDYDGTLTNSYTKTEFLQLTELPSNPTHTGLTAQGWNWTLSDAQTYVTDYGELNIGQVYKPTSDQCEFDVDLNVGSGKYVRLNMDGTKDWGDGTSDTNTSHTYTDYGKYTIKCNGTTLTSSSSVGLFNQNDGYPNYYVTAVRLTNVSSVPNSSFAYCYSLRQVLLSNDVTSINSYCFRDNGLINIIILPSSFTRTYDYAFGYMNNLEIVISPLSFKTYGSSTYVNCYNLKKINISTKINGIASSLLSNCKTLEKIILPKTSYTISTGAFSNCNSILIYDFRNNTSVPTLQSSTEFNKINKLAKIIVPDSLYESWIATGNWVNYVNYIVKVSDL